MAPERFEPDGAAGSSRTTTPVRDREPERRPDGLGPLSNPDCDGGYIVIVGSAVNPDEYQHAPPTGGATSALKCVHGRKRRAEDGPCPHQGTANRKRP